MKTKERIHGNLPNGGTQQDEQKTSYRIEEFQNKFWVCLKAKALRL